MKRIVVLCAAAALSIPGAFAQNGANGLGREKRQQTRIEKGEQSGQLTPREAGRLERKQARVENRVDKVGTATPAQRAADRKMLHRQSARIRAQKHDANGVK